MAVVQAIVSSSRNTFQTFKGVGKEFTKNINSLLCPYAGGYIIFDNYHKKLTLKDDIRYTTEGEDLIIEELTPVRDMKKVMASSKSKDNLTLYLADTLIAACNEPVITVILEDMFCQKDQS